MGTVRPIVMSKIADDGRDTADEWARETMLHQGAYGSAVIRARQREEHGRIVAPRPLASYARVETALVWTCGLVYFGIGVAYALLFRVYTGDAIARTGQAAAVLLSRDPHLAAIGFIWNPLPALLRLPFIAILAPFGHRNQGLLLIAGPATSAIFGALSVRLVARLCEQFGASRQSSLLFACLFALNPMLLLYSANGMSETCLLYFVIWTALHLIRWVNGQQMTELLLAAMGLAVATWVRYEALPLIAAAVVVVALCSAVDRRERWTISRAEGVLLALLVPSVYSLGLWLFFNWQIEGDPLFFYHSIYSNAAQTAAIRASTTARLDGYGNLVRAAWFAMTRITAVSPFFLPLLVLLGISVVRRFDLSVLTLLLLSLALPAFHVFLLYRGSLFGVLRYFLYPLPFTFVFAAITRVQIDRATYRRAWRVTGRHAAALRLNRITPLLLGILLLLGDVGTGVAMAQPAIGPDEQPYVAALTSPIQPNVDDHGYRLERQLAAYLDAHPDGLTLMDTGDDVAYPVFLFSRNPRQFVTTSDRDFERALVDPQLYVNRVLVHRGDDIRDRVTQQYPSLYAHGAPWALLERQIGPAGEWRVYRVLKPLTSPSQTTHPGPPRS